MNLHKQLIPLSVKESPLVIYSLLTVLLITSCTSYIDTGSTSTSSTPTNASEEPSVEWTYTNAVYDDFIRSAQLYSE
ncbi:MAG: hypothetical protein P8O05_13295, partial [Flavobacteriales bacterium]|nr:hypothetical protein [Flavobacteriales bacterium]